MPDKIEDLHKEHDAQLVVEIYGTIQGDRVVVKFRDKPPKRWQNTRSGRHRYNQGTLRKNVTAVILSGYTNVKD